MNSGIKWFEADLQQRLALCLRYLEGMLDPEKDMEPYFYINREADGTGRAGHALEIGIPHVTGRALDIIYGIEHATGQRLDAGVEKVYTDYLFSCCDLEDYLPVYFDPNKQGKPYVEFHNLRECLEGLVWLVKLRGSERAGRVIKGFLDTLEQLTDSSGAWNPELLHSLPAEKADKFYRFGLALPMGQGRLVGPLVLLYQLTGEARVLRLAGGYAETTMERCFDDNGQIRDCAANHVHSITSTLTGVMAYAQLVKRQDLVQKVRRIYEVGLREAYSTYGYCKEQLWIESEQGESNQVGDLIQLFFMLAKEDNPAHWYGCAERFMRGGILPAQVLETDSYMTEVEAPESDARRRMTERAIGGFGFPNPTCHMNGEHCALNTIDITQGAAQAICAFLRQIVTKTALGLRVNLFFTAETPFASVASELPLKGRVSVTPKYGDFLAVRIPQNIENGSFCLTVDGQKRDYTVLEGYALLGKVEAGQEVCVTFQPKRLERQEYVCHKLYTVQWFGEQACGVRPLHGVYPLFGEWEQPEHSLEASTAQKVGVSLNV